ncbi:hypothetical protein [Amycolatopsis albispora]|uniref:Lipoprotein n=1 Tax=Amycolatopsis albispora TaxID=1804986 RepID=A0A344LGA6_9PSEU|nr:hypothetical protein [Amycolatopsis albispora]AXB47080.1 hypothetical protein A4R43_35385 [Amycolatopsis albispora]
MRTATALVGALLIGTLAACGGGTGAGMDTTITLDEANRRLDAYITEAVAQLPAGAQLKERLRIEEEPCDDVAGEKGKQQASRNYQVTGIDPAEIPAQFETLRAWWQNNGFRILDNNPAGEFLWVENEADGFRMTLKAADGGRLVLISSSPCVWRDGTPD